jgi:hypothetical protein
MNQTETKAVAGAAGGGAGAVTAEFVDYLLQITAYHHHSVPTVVASFVLVACSGGLAFVSAWLAPHTPQAAPAVVDPAVPVITPAP